MEVEKRAVRMKKVLIIGAGFLQDFVIRKAKSMGYEVIAVDANPTSVGFRHADKYKVISIVDEQACLAYAKEEKIDGVLTAATDYGVLTAAYIAKELGLPGLNYEAAKLIKNKYQVRKCLFEAKVDDTEQAYAVNENTDLAALAEKLSFPVMVKPCDGSGSRGVARVDEALQFADACKNAMAASITHCAEVETFITGREYGAESLVVNGEAHVLGIMRKWMTAPPYYAELGHAMPSGLDDEVEKKVIGCVEKAIEALGINFGSVNMDLLVTEDNKVHIVDIGARMGGNLIGSHIIPYGTGIPYIENMIKAHTGESIDFKPAKVPQPVATRILALKPGMVEQLPAMQSMDDIMIEHHLKIGDMIHEYRTNLDGCGYVVCIADTMNNAEMKAEREKERINIGIKRKK